MVLAERETVLSTRTTGCPPYCIRVEVIVGLGNSAEEQAEEGEWLGGLLVKKSGGKGINSSLRTMLERENFRRVE